MKNFLRLLPFLICVAVGAQAQNQIQIQLGSQVYPIAPGTNVTFITNNGVISISSVGGSGGGATNAFNTVVATNAPVPSAPSATVVAVPTNYVTPTALGPIIAGSNYVAHIDFTAQTNAGAGLYLGTANGAQPGNLYLGDSSAGWNQIAGGAGAVVVETNFSFTGKGSGNGSGLTNNTSLPNLGANQLVSSNNMSQFYQSNALPVGIVITNAYYTNTATILPTGNSLLAVGTNNFVGGGGGSGSGNANTNNIQAQVFSGTNVFTGQTTVSNHFTITTNLWVNGNQTNGGNITITNGQFTGNGSGLTNLNTTIYPSIAAMIASSLTNSCQVGSYYGTNDEAGRAWGGGQFNFVPTNGLSTNFGTVFASQDPVHYWQRVVANPNVMQAEWFGVCSSLGPVTSAYSLIDCTTNLQNCVNVTPVNGMVIIPNMAIGITNLTLFNVIGLHIVGASRPQGANNVNNSPVLFYDGGVVTTNAVISVYNAGEITLDGIEIESSPPNNILTTNIADIGVDVDQFAGHTQITTHNLIENCFIGNNYSTNTPQWRGVRLSYTSQANVEFSKLVDDVFIGSYGNYTNNPSYGTAIEIGNNSNAYNEQFYHLEWAACAYGIKLAQGSFSLDGFLSEYAVNDFSISNATGSILIENGRAEGPLCEIAFGQAEGGITYMANSVDMNYSNTTPMFQNFDGGVGGIPVLNMVGNFIGLQTGATLFAFTNVYGYSVLNSIGNNYKHTSTNVWGGFTASSGVSQVDVFPNLPGLFTWPAYIPAGMVSTPNGFATNLTLNGQNVVTTNSGGTGYINFSGGSYGVFHDPVNSWYTTVGINANNAGDNNTFSINLGSAKKFGIFGAIESDINIGATSDAGLVIKGQTAGQTANPFTIYGTNGGIAGWFDTNGVWNGNGSGLTNLPATAITGVALTNVTAAASSTNLPGTDQNGHQVTVPWSGLPSGGGSTTLVPTNKGVLYFSQFPGVYQTVEMFTNCWMTNNGVTLTCSNATAQYPPYGFTNTMIGWHCRAVLCNYTNGCMLDLGSIGTQFCTITNVLNPTNVQISMVCSNLVGGTTTCTNTIFYCGIDDGTNLQNAINYCISNQITDLKIDGSIYMDLPFTQTNTYLSQIWFPYLASPAQTVIPLTIEGITAPLVGGGNAPLNQGYAQGHYLAASLAGTWIVDGQIGSGMQNNLQPGNGPQFAESVFCGGTNVNFNNIGLVFKNIGIRTASNPLYSVMNMSDIGNFSMYSVEIDGGFLSYCGPQLAGYLGQLNGGAEFGVAMPTAGNNGPGENMLQNVCISGMFKGLYANEHLDGNDVFIETCYEGLIVCNQNEHPIHFGKLSLQSCAYGILPSGGGVVYIDELDVEHIFSGNWYDTQADIYDKNNVIYGNINWVCINGAQLIILDGNAKTNRTALNLNLHPLGGIAALGAVGYGSFSAKVWTNMTTMSCFVVLTNNSVGAQFFDQNANVIAPVGSGVTSMVLHYGGWLTNATTCGGYYYPSY